MPDTRLVIGCMTGTSLDGLDAVLACVHGRGKAITADYLGLHSEPFPYALRETLLGFARGEAAPPLAFLEAARSLGQLHATSCQALLEQTNTHAAALSFVVAHGQTICHAPQSPPPLGPMSWQLLDPWPIARVLGVPVCYDLRQANLIAGGEGAPITPITDPLLYPDADAVLNLGGICNATFMPAGTIDARDVCPCNLLLDTAVRHLFPGQRYDKDGQHAAAGRPDARLQQTLTEDFEQRTRGRRTLGREELCEPALTAILDDAVARGLSAEDTLATCVAAVAQWITAALPETVKCLILAGGGARNQALTAALQAAAPHATLTSTTAFGHPPEAREALAFALLGCLSQDGVSITLPQITGAETPGVAGAWVNG